MFRFEEQRISLYSRIGKDRPSFQKCWRQGKDAGLLLSRQENPTTAAVPTAAATADPEDH
jgi:hypothetical protein